MTSFVVTVQKYIAADPADNPPPTGFGAYQIVDSADNIEKLTPADIFSDTLSGITSDKGSVALTVALALTLETKTANVPGGGPIMVTAPSGDNVSVAGTVSDFTAVPLSEYSVFHSIGATAVSVTDSAADIEGMSAKQILDLGLGNLALTITSNDNSLALTVAQAVVLEALHVEINFNLVVPSGDTITVSDTEANIETLTPDQVASLASIGVTAYAANDISTTISVARYRDDVAALQNNQFTYAGPVAISDTAASIQLLSPADIDAARSIGLGQINSAESVELTVAQAVALESQLVPIVVPGGGYTVAIADLASNLVTLTPTEIAGLPFIGVSSIAAVDTPALLSAAQMSALGAASIPVVAPPANPMQNDGNAQISGPDGTGLTFDVTWAPSVASAPVSFVADAVAAFQFYANLITNTTTLYYTVGYGSVGDGPVGLGDLGQNNPEYETGGPLTYASVTAQMVADEQSPAQLVADAFLPQTDPYGGEAVAVPEAELQALGLPNTDAPPSASNPDDILGASDTTLYNFSTDPEAVLSGTYGLVGVLEHEISEGMGRLSEINTKGPNGTSTKYGPIDFFRYAAPNQLQLTNGAPSYFSINNGATNLDFWNNNQTGNSGDLADWAPSALNDSFDDSNQTGPDPVTPTDILLMNVLGYDISPLVTFNADYIEALTPAGIGMLAEVGIKFVVATDVSVLLTAAQGVAFEDAPINVQAPQNEGVALQDSYADIQSLTQAQYDDLPAAGIEDLLLTDTAADIEALTPAELATFDNLGATNIVSIRSTDASVVLTVAQALAIEGDAIPVIVPVGDTVTITDAAGAVGALSAAQIAKLPTIGVSVITVTDGSVTLSVAQAVALDDGDIILTVPIGDSISVSDTADAVLGLTPGQLGYLASIGVMSITIADTAAGIEAIPAGDMADFPQISVTALVSTSGSVGLSASQAVALEGDYLPAIIRVTAPTGDTVTVSDTAANIETLTASQITGLPAIGVTGITATSGAVMLTVAQILAILGASLNVAFPLGSSLRVSDSTEAIGSLTPAQINQLRSLGVTKLVSDEGPDSAISMTVAQALVLEVDAMSVSVAGVPDASHIEDTAANIASLTALQIEALPAAGFGGIEVSDGGSHPHGVPVTVAQALALEDTSIYIYGNNLPLSNVEVTDTAAHIETLTPTQISGLSAIGLAGQGPIYIDPTDGSLAFSVAQARQIYNSQAAQSLLAFVFPAGGTITIHDTSANLLSFIETVPANDIDQLLGDGLTGFVSTLGSVTLSFSQANLLLGWGTSVTVPTGDAVTINDSATNIDGMAPSYIADLGSLGVSAITTLAASVQLDVAQALALEAVNIVVSAGSSVIVADTLTNIEELTQPENAALSSIGVTGLEVIDTAAAIEALTQSQISSLTATGVTAIRSSDASVVLTVAQASYLEAAALPVTVPGGDEVTVADNVPNLDTLTAPEIAALPLIGVTAMTAIETEAGVGGLAPGQITSLGTLGITTITVTDASVTLLAAQAQALEAASVTVVVPTGDTVTIVDSPDNILTLTPSQIASLPATGVSAITTNAASVELTIAQAEAIGPHLSILAPSGLAPSGPIILADTAANIDGFLSGGAVAAVLTASNATSIMATDVTVSLSVAEALALESANTSLGKTVAIGAPPGQSVMVADTAANIEGMTPGQIAELSTLGVTSVVATDTGLVLTVAKALAFYDPLSIAVPTGDQVVIADTESQIDLLTPSEVSGLAALGANSIEVSDLTGAAALTIDGGTTLAVAGAVPEAQTIVFAGRGGTLSLSDTKAFGGIIDGLTPEDAIDLTDAGYDPTATASLGGGNVLTVVEASGTYTLQLDPTQIFLTTPAWQAAPDAGTGTEITYAQPAFSAFAQVTGGQTLDGAVVAYQAEVDATGGTVNRAIIQSGGVLRIDAGATVSGTTIDSGGSLELQSGAITGDATTFGPASSGTAGGTLAIDGTIMPAAAIANVAQGDVIDLTSIPYDNGGSATIESGNTLQVIESGATYDLALDPSQVFLNQTFALSPDTNIGTDITETAAPLMSGAVIPALGYANGAMVGSGGRLTIDPTGMLNNGVVGAGGLVDRLAGGSLGNAFNFGADGGTVDVGGSIPSMTTVYGFGGNDVIALPGVAFDPTATPTVAAGNQLQFTANGTAYSLSIDPEQLFLGSFSLKGDGSTGTDITLTQTPITTDEGVNPGQSLAGVVVAATGHPTIAGSVVNIRIDTGGTADVHAGGTISYAVITNGGLLDLSSGSSASGAIGFGPVAGGTLEIGDTSPFSATLTGFAAGDTIDLTAVPHVGTDRVALLSDGTLQLVTSVGTYDLRLSASDNFAHDYFYLSRDAVGGTDIGIINESTARTLIWTGGQGTSFNDAANWDDATTNLDPAPLAPDPADIAEFLTNGGAIGGGGTVAAATFDGGGIWQFAAGGALTVSGSMIVGASEATGLLIDDGASVIAAGTAAASIANTAAASGSSVNVSGAGSTWRVSGLLDAGVAGSGALELSGGATVTAGSLDAGNIASAVGQIGLSGPGTELSVANAATVADDGAGVLSVLNGATFSAASLTIGSRNDSSGALIVSGNGSVLQISGALNIGTALGTGDLTVGPGAVVNAAVVNLQGGVVLEGGLLDPTVFIENGGSTTGGFGTVSSQFILLEGTILSNGSKSGKETEVVQGTVVGGGTATIQGSVSVNGPGILQIGTHDTIELTGAVLNAATTTFTDNLTPTGTYSINNSVIDVVFQDTTGVLQLDDIAGFAGTVATWKAGDSFVITGGTLSNVGVSNGNTLTVQDSGAGAGSGGIDTIIFGSAISPGGVNIIDGNTVQAVACFAEGTSIETERGPVPVEHITVEDRLVTVGGASEPVVWVGSRTVNCARHPEPETVWPVRVRAGAFGAGRPRRDLFLSPDHAVFVNGVLVPVKLLADGASIVQESRDQVTYYHVELPEHAVILAEGLAVESYLDTGDRANFGRDGVMRPHPDFAARLAPDTAWMWESRGAAPLVTVGRALEALRRTVLENTSRSSQFQGSASRTG